MNSSRGRLSLRREASSALAAVVLFVLLVAPTANAAPVVAAALEGGTRVGLVESIYYSAGVRDETTSAPWRALQTGLARIAVPFDMGKRPASDPYRTTFQAWLQGVTSSGAQPYVTFMAVNPPQSSDYPLFYDNYNSSLAHTPGAGHCYAFSNGETHCSAPSLSVYTDALNAFLTAFPSVKVIGAWNEPDYNYSPKASGGTGRRYYTPDDQYYMYTADCDSHPASTSCGPNLAAHYWQAVKDAFTANHCDAPTCLAVAGEFSASQPAAPGENNYGYWGSYAYYLRALGSYPYIWATHPYGEVSRGNATTTDTILKGGDSGASYLGPDSPMYRTHELPAVNGVYPTSHLWDSAGGAAHNPDFLDHHSDLPCPLTQGARLGCWIDKVRALNSASGPSYSRGRVPRVYVYDYRSACSGAENDDALVCPGSPDTPDKVVKRPAYDVIAQQIAQGGN